MSKNLKSLDDVKTFSDYWELKKGLYKQLGVSQDVCYQIWCDCAIAIRTRLNAHLK